MHTYIADLRIYALQFALDTAYNLYHDYCILFRDTDNNEFAYRATNCLDLSLAYSAELDYRLNGELLPSCD